MKIDNTLVFAGLAAILATGLLLMCIRLELNHIATAIDNQTVVIAETHAHNCETCVVTRGRKEPTP